MIVRGKSYDVDLATAASEFGMEPVEFLKMLSSREDFRGIEMRVAGSGGIGSLFNRQDLMSAKHKYIDELRSRVRSK